MPPPPPVAPRGPPRPPPVPPEPPAAGLAAPRRPPVTRRHGESTVDRRPRFQQLLIQRQVVVCHPLGGVSALEDGPHAVAIQVGDPPDRRHGFVHTLDDKAALAVFHHLRHRPAPP